MVKRATGSDKRWPFRWDLLLRYRYIEILAMWEGRLTTRHLCETFGIGRQQASKDINTYLKDVAAGNLEYDKHLKGYKPSPSFRPVVTQGVADEYLHLMARNNELSSMFESLDLQAAAIEVLSVPLRDVSPTVLRPLVQAARQQKRVEVDYVSVQNPDRDGRVIVPHTIVHTGLRWHVRAWCEKNLDYRDFVLSRFRGEADIMDESEHGVDGDTRWSDIVEIRVVPDSRLSKSQQEVVARDYGMTRGKLAINTRGALVQYALKALHIDTAIVQIRPEAQQIMVENLTALEPYLFH
ncbi:MAG: WYL domain-containing protein [Halieaceae bacterium]|jgi:predicted DNA-binding transcriptional regulator YafY|nr:WYL domain-containing protein [Halieaceae bacterium]